MFTGTEAVAFLKDQPAETSKRSSPFLRIRGDIQYDFTYRSFTDTPFMQNDFTQHSIQASFDIVIKDKYPLKMILLNRRTNSPFFDNVTDVSLRFDKQSFLNNLKGKLEKQLPGTIHMNKLSEAERLYQQKQWEIESLQRWLSRPEHLQRMVEEKEGKLPGLAQREVIKKVSDEGLDVAYLPIPDKGKLGRIQDSIQERIKIDSALNTGKKAERKAGEEMLTIQDSILEKMDSAIVEKTGTTDSLTKTGVQDEYNQKQTELKKAIEELQSQRQTIAETKKLLQDSLNQLKRQLAQVKDPRALQAFIRENKLGTEDLPKGWQAIAVINGIGLGRSWLDYSELTVKNISLTGVNADLNISKIYFGFAAGRVNYRFRDFVISSNNRNRQSLYLLRAGIGKSQGNNVILTWYDGKKDVFSSFASPQAIAKLQQVSGFSIESRLQLDINNYVILELGRSSYGRAGREGKAKIWKLDDRSNEAYSIKINSYWPRFATRIAGYYRKMGENFQSFNLQPVNINQEAYQLKVQQSFFKRKLSVEAGIRKNDFSSPFINPGVATKTVFKSIQATLRIKKYPFVSVGYFPSSQLTVSENKTLVENQYNTLNLLVSHSYRLRNLHMTSNLVYLKFFNSGSDSGFIYYNAANWFANQYFSYGRFRFQSGLTWTRRSNLKIIVLEQSVSCQLSKWLMMSGGLRYNSLNRDKVMWSGTAGIGILLKHIGTVQMNYDKSFFPGTRQNLMPVEMGRVTYTKTF